MSRLLVVAPEWLGKSGLWVVDAKGRREAVDAEEFGLSEDLADRLENWMDEFDSIYDEGNEERSAFANEVERIRWEAEGAAIAQAISAEVGNADLVQLDLSEWHRKVGK